MKILMVKGKECLLDDDIYEQVKNKSWYLMNNYVLQRNRIGKGNEKETKFLHHFVLPITGTNKEVDHIDRNPLNNQRSNLRLIEHWQNGHNRPIQSNNTTGHKGISWSKVQQQWHAYIWIKGKRIHLGYFNDYDMAVNVRKEAEIKYL